MISNINTAFGKDWTFINLFKLHYCSWHINSVISFYKIKFNFSIKLSWADFWQDLRISYTKKEARKNKEHLLQTGNQDRWIWEAEENFL